jgi:hypothetical protein
MGISKDTLSLLVVAALLVAFIWSYFTASSKKDPVLPTSGEPIEEPDALLSLVEEDVTEDDQVAAIEAITVEQTVEIADVQVNTMFLGINMALLPDDSEKVQLTWLRDQMVSCQTKGQKRSITYAAAGNRMKDYYLFLGKEAAKAVQKTVTLVADDSIGSATP